jgi:hypothetical protein
MAGRSGKRGHFISSRLAEIIKCLLVTVVDVLQQT